MKRTVLWFLSFSFLFLSSCGILHSQNDSDVPPELSSSHFSPETDSSGNSSHSNTAAGDNASDPGKNSSAQNDVSAPEQPTEYVDPSTLPNTMSYWWFKRNEDHQIPSVQEEIKLTDYDAWYAHTNLKEGEKPVYLTFDCGYENGYTPGILDVLKKHNAPAAFFLCKHFIADQTPLVKRMKEEGHVVGNHTANHICMPESDERTIREEIANNAEYMKEATGYEMDYFFRPPKGEYSERTLQITKEMGYTTIFWSLAYLDYDVNNQPGANYVIEQFNKYIHPGAIPLIHNISESNAQALDTVLTNLENEGYTFHSLYDLSETGNSDTAKKERSGRNSSAASGDSQAKNS